jgi:hypothetical protein
MVFLEFTVAVMHIVAGICYCWLAPHHDPALLYASLGGAMIIIGTLVIARILIRLRKCRR